MYQSIATFSEYLLVGQTRPYVTHYWRNAADSGWFREDIVGLEREVFLSSIGGMLTFREIYRLVDFTAVGQ